MIEALSQVANGAVILALIGVIWGMRKGEIQRIEKGLQKDIDRLDIEIKDLRVRKHDMIDVTTQTSGRVSSLEEDMESVKRKIYLVDQLLQYQRAKDSD